MPDDSPTEPNCGFCETTETSRGFRLGEFADANGVRCSIQESSLAADEGHLWLGCSEIGLKKFTPFKGWEDVPLENNPPNGITHIANTRMHLSQSQVRDLLPMLRHFAEHGSLPEAQAAETSHGATPDAGELIERLRKQAMTHLTQHAPVKPLFAAAAARIEADATALAARDQEIERLKRELNDYQAETRVVELELRVLELEQELADMRRGPIEYPPDYPGGFDGPTGAE